MEDYLVRVIAKESGVRGLACLTTNLVQEGARRHETAPTATAALGRALTAGALLGATLKVKQRVALKFAGSGPLEKIIVESDSYGRLRGYVAHPEVDLPRRQDGSFDVDRSLGFGQLTVVKDLRLKELAEGVVPLATGQIDEDLELYLNQSEQTPSAVQVGVLLDEADDVEIAGGVLIQVLADQDATLIHTLAERLLELPPVAEMLAAGQTPEDVLAAVLGEIEYVVLEQRPLTFQCTCSWERSEKALISLGRAELKSLLEEGQAVVDCHFCHERYIFNRERLEDLLAQAT